MSVVARDRDLTPGRFKERIVRSFLTAFGDAPVVVVKFLDDERRYVGGTAAETFRQAVQARPPHATASISRGSGIQPLVEARPAALRSPPSLPCVATQARARAARSGEAGGVACFLRLALEAFKRTHGRAEALVVEDAAQHPLFCDHPFVVGAPHIALFASAILRLAPRRGRAGPPMPIGAVLLFMCPPAPGVAALTEISQCQVRPRRRRSDCAMCVQGYAVPWARGGG
jgi:hypothetical protein